MIKISKNSFAVILFFMFLLVGLRVYRNFNISRNLKNEEKNKLKKSAEVLNECFDLKNKSQRTLNDSMKLIEYCMEKYGYEEWSNEVLYSGITGEQLKTSIFMGPTYYQRLKIMVADKMHSRGTGPLQSLTRQPAAGRSNNGGLRIGEMERDCMASHGMSRFSKDRLYDVSDKYHIYVCKLCGIQAQFNDEEKIHNCPICKNKTTFSRVNIPFSCKLLFQELISMNIVPRILT